MFVGCLCYADDVVLLAPSIDALRRMLHVCSAFADDYGLRFNPTKTQLICFTRSHSHPPPHTPLMFGGVPLFYKDTVSHLGHILSHDLSDSADILGLLRIWFIRQTACLQPSHVQTHWLKLIYFVHSAYHTMVHPCGGYPAKL